MITATTCSALGKPTNESVFHRCTKKPQARSMPTPETPEVVNVNCSIFSNAGGGWNRGFSHTGLSRGQNLSSSGSMCAFLSCLFIAVGG